MRKFFDSLASVFLFCWILSSCLLPLPAFAQEDKKPFLLSPTAGWYLPTSSKTRNAFGDSWFGFGVALNLGALGFENTGFEVAKVRLYPYLGYINGSKGDNAAHIVPLGLEARWNLAHEEESVIKPYVGLGAAVYGVKFHNRGAGVESNWRGAYGGRMLVGTDITKWFNLEASYNLISKVKDYDFSGFSINAKITFYF